MSNNSVKVIVAGSRTIGDEHYPLVEERLDEMRFNANKIHGKTLEIVSGLAKGPDQMGVRYAKRRGLKWHEFPANWRPGGVFNRNAGKERNEEMAKFADRLLALWDGESGGTANMIAHAVYYGLSVEVIRPKE